MSIEKAIGGLFPTVAAGTLGPLAGALISKHSQEKQQELAIRKQEEFAKQGIQWRVADAKAAGLHPLFALGASTSGPTIPVMEDPLGKAVSDMGQNVSRAIAAQETPDQREMRYMLLEKARSDVMVNHAQAAKLMSEARRMQQGVGPGMPGPNLPGFSTYNPVHVTAGGGDDGQGDTQFAGPTPPRPGGYSVFGYPFAPQVFNHPLFADAFKFKEPDVISRQKDWPGVVAGPPQAHMIEMMSPSGKFTYLWPATGDKPKDEIEFSDLPLIFGANKERYGWRFFPNFVRYVTGQQWTEGMNLERFIRGVQDRIRAGEDLPVDERQYQSGRSRGINPKTGR